jgi:hypothetical protein
VDDGVITGTNLIRLQQFLGILTLLFVTIQLKTNTTKTKVHVEFLANPKSTTTAFVHQSSIEDLVDPILYMISSRNKLYNIEIEIPAVSLQRVLSLPCHMINVHSIYKQPTQQNSNLSYFAQEPSTYRFAMEDDNNVDSYVPSCSKVATPCH